MRVPLSLTLMLFTLGCTDADGDGVGGKRDCDDADRAAYTGAVEICDGIDNDCNGQVDEGVSITVFQDRDGDGFGDTTRVRRVCEMPADGVEVDGDCDDFNPGSFPGAEETCDGADNNCDGEVDEGLGDLFFLDADGDGHGIPGTTITACVVPEGYSRVDDDCDDTNELRWTDAPERCDQIDNDCDGDVDEDLVSVVLHVDADLDGYGDPELLSTSCGVQEGLVDNGEDCDDTDPSLNPDTPEVPYNGITDDCDPWVDEFEVPGAYGSLEDALLVANPGDVIQMGRGVFTGPFDMQGTEVSLVGEGCARTTLFGDGVSAVVVADGGHIGDLTITGGAASGMRTEGIVSASNLCVRENFAIQGGGIDVASGVLTLEDSLIANNATDSNGGGIHVGQDAELVAHRIRVIGNSSDHDAGAMAVRSGVATVVSSVFAANSTFDDGGAITTRQLQAAPAGDPPVLHLLNVTLHRNDNRAARDPALSEQSQGLAIYSIYDGSVLIEDSIITGHDVPDHAAMYSRNAGVHQWGTLLLDNNGLVDIREGHLTGAVRGDPRFVDDTDPDPLQWDLRLLPGSPAIGAAASGTNPDGSPADLGAFGGDLAPEDFDAGYALDGDGDGLTDAWELAHGTAVDLADASEDPDADGLTHAEEFAAYTDPFDPDSDGDSALDGEDAAPLSELDQQPSVIVLPVTMALVGEEVVLDASASFDPQGDALTWSWSLEPALGSTLTTVSGQEVGRFTPDLQGTWTATLTLDDGSRTAEASVVIEVVVPSVIVPDEEPSLQVALDGALDGDVIAVRPGTWPAEIEANDFGLTILGLGDASEVILQGTGDHVASATNNGHLDLRNVTLTGGNSILAGGGFYCLQSSASFTDVIIRDNTATGSVSNGGGMWASLCTLDATRLQVLDNEAGRHGGGLYTTRSALDFHDVTFSGNVAADEGGGMWLEQRAEFADLDHCVFQGNTAIEGAALFLSGSTLYETGVGDPGNGRVARINHGAFVDNTGDSIVYVEDGRLQMFSPLLAYNTAVTVFSGVLADDGIRYSVLRPLFWDNAGLPWLDTAWAPRDVWSVDPQVLAWTDDGDATNDVWTLRPGSPAADLGLPDVVDHDGSISAVGPAGGDAPRWWASDAVDLDGDGMSDGWERRFGLDPSIDDSAGDLDGDGQTNGAEYAMGTLP